MVSFFNQFSARGRSLSFEQDESLLFAMMGRASQEQRPA
jgi:hypothetical protein